MQPAVGEDAGAEAAAVFEEIVGSRGEGLVHPVARAALADAFEVPALDLEGFSDEGVQVDAAGDDVAAEDGGRRTEDGGRKEGSAEVVVNFDGEERDLSLVVFLVVEEAVAAQAATGDALAGVDLKGRVLSGGQAVVAEVVVPGGNEEPEDFDDHPSFVDGIPERGCRPAERGRARNFLIGPMREVHPGVSCGGPCRTVGFRFRSGGSSRPSRGRRRRSRRRGRGRCPR